MPSRSRTATSLRILALLLVLAAACPSALAQSKGRAKSGPPTLVFMTDFGVVDDSVAICKGVMLGVEPELRIVDITHEVTPYSILDGARFLAGASPYFPAGTVFVVVVDPGVGSTRRAIVARSKRGQYFVLPDNGLLTLVLDRDGLDSAREITNTAWMEGTKLSSTFHGRDIFSPVGARIAAGQDWTKIGPAVTGLVRLDVKAPRLDERGLSGEVIALDGPYGNLVTNVSAEEFAALGYALGDKIEVTIGEKKVALSFVRTFSDVPVGESLLYVDSRGHLALAVNQASFAERFGVTPPTPIVFPRKQAPRD